ncbi:D-alanyl-D-alanine carboxypeptidase family protein [Ferdinandcohnia quinoae]|uniref:serine-type D-Ala-D-Ala carboxypeptidase n=1 Tax=Fredinandcohnia quinoae TaxID=2918902 RepID=A0AAW5E0J7_9BACI|nr:D-alanyl-D-alanine carboxypeptidase family protein [Fredinandcohnia sp. SECRCQ15]MCH1624800.1 D-alanyl-D-alanine carboxypeptidase [Fredinandcohnia sp. SECRCQ15]
MTLFRKRVILVITVVLLTAILTPQRVNAVSSISAKGAILIEQESGRIIYEKNAYTKMRIASITKIMTAILAIESGKMEDMVKVSSKAVGTEGSSLYLQPNEKIKLEDLVYGLMLRSGNDAAVAISEHVGGSIEGFVFLMNQKAAEIGMRSTEFANPHGLDDHENHYSTAYDMAILTRYAMKNERFREISGTKVYRSPNPNEKWDRVWRNKNKLLTKLYPYSTGGKTGYTKRAKRTLVSTASKDGLDLIAVTINASNDWNDHMNMFNHGFGAYDLVKIVKKGKLKNINQQFYKNKVFIDHDYLYPLTEEERANIKVHISLMNPKENDWEDRNDVPDIVGTLTVNLADDTITEIPIYFQNGKGKKPNLSYWETLKSIFLISIGVK